MSLYRTVLYTAALFLALRCGGSVSSQNTSSPSSYHSSSSPQTNKNSSVQDQSLPLFTEDDFLNPTRGYKKLTELLDANPLAQGLAAAVVGVGVDPSLSGKAVFFYRTISCVRVLGQHPETQVIEAALNTGEKTTVDVLRKNLDEHLSPYGFNNCVVLPGGNAHVSQLHTKTPYYYLTIQGQGTSMCTK